MNSGVKPASRKTNIVVQELEDEILIYDLMENKALCLNETSALIWQECDGHKSVSEISQTLSKKLKSKVNEDVVWLAIRQFKKDNLFAQSDQFTTPLDGLTRREIVKRIGFASMVALPLIASVTAPSAIHAASTCAAPPTCPPPTMAANLPTGCVCQSSLDCQEVCIDTTMICAGGNITPGGFCSPPGNQLFASAPCCPCNSSIDCVGVCLSNTMLCA